MRLTELRPRWFALERGGLRVGLTFDCPHCRTERLGVTFHRQGFEAIDDQYIRAHRAGDKPIWGKTGDSFDDITLTPSVDGSKYGHWHGFITNGEIVGGL